MFFLLYPSVANPFLKLNLRVKCKIKFFLV